MATVALSDPYGWLDLAVQAVDTVAVTEVPEPPQESPEVVAFMLAVSNVSDEASLAEALDLYARLNVLYPTPPAEDAAQKLAAFISCQAVPLLQRALRSLAVSAEGVRLGHSSRALRDGTHLETVLHSESEEEGEVMVYATLPRLAHTLTQLLQFVADHLAATQRSHGDLRVLLTDFAALFHQGMAASTAGQPNAGGLWWPLVIHNNSTVLVAHALLRMHLSLAGCSAAGEALATTVWLEAERLRAAVRQQVDDISELHLTLMRCFVFPDLEAANWGRWNKYFNNTRCSNVLAAWQLHIKACIALCGKCRAWMNHPQEILLKTLSVLCGRYSRLKPTKSRSPQFRVDVWYLIAWTRSFRSHMTCPTVCLTIDQTLLDMAAIACILTNPLAEVVRFFEVRGVHKASKSSRDAREVLPAALWESPCFSLGPDGLDPLVEYYALGGRRINHEEVVACSINLQVVDLSSLSAEDCLEWASRRPEMWDTVSGPLSEEEQALVARLRTALTTGST